MDVLKDRIAIGQYLKLMGLLNKCLIDPLAKLWSCAPKMVKWDASTGSYPPPRGKPTRTVVFAGSFNPPHAGHLEIIRYLAAAHKQVHVVIGVNPFKTYPVSAEVRKEIIEGMVQGSDLQNVQVHIWGDAIFKLAKLLGATALYRGLRSWEEDGKAERHLEVQNLCWPTLSSCGTPMSTYYVEGPQAHKSTSSTLLRNRIKSGEPINDIVPECVVQKVLGAYGEAVKNGKL
mmetsp:Transcript_19661/g.55282  ORF Transcript_19661/g.55282 Transcript_19661/m.55282 type:complete len:231 (-) Transcript_19661:84-776(-)